MITGAVLTSDTCVPPRADSHAARVDRLPAEPDVFPARCHVAGVVVLTRDCQKGQRSARLIRPQEEPTTAVAMVTPPQCPAPAA